MDLGKGAFAVVDHWEADLCAVGLARPSDERFLIYLSTWPPESGLYSYQLESPARGDDSPYTAGDLVADAAYEAVFDAARCHLLQQP